MPPPGDASDAMERNEGRKEGIKQGRNEVKKEGSNEAMDEHKTKQREFKQLQIMKISSRHFSKRE